MSGTPERPTGGDELRAARRRLGRPRSALSRLGHRQQLLLVVLVGFGAVTIGFSIVAEEVAVGSTARVDERVLLLFRVAGDTADPVGPDWLEETARDVTSLGSNGVVALLVLAVAGWLWLQGKGRAAIYVLLAVGGGMVVSNLIKGPFARPRPDLVAHEARTFTTSFPSAHAMVSAVAYLTIGTLLGRFQPKFRVKAYLFLLGLAAAMLVGVSRVYLGVHWPSDVVAGWAAGSAWALAAWSLAFALQRRGRIDG